MYTGHQFGSLSPSIPQDSNLPLVTLLLQARVTVPAVGVDQAPGLNAIFHEEVEVGG